MPDEQHDYDAYLATAVAAAKEAGALRLEGKEYVCREGDVMLFRSGI